MKLYQLKLLNFRNYEKLDLSFSDKYNIIYGQNASGKTNLVESIYVLSFTKSFRGSTDKILIQSDKDVSYIEGLINEDNDNTKYRITINNSGKKVKINNNKIDKLSDYISKINVVLFNPDSLRFIKDSPGIRRKELNLELSQLDNKYLKNLSNYNKLIENRNAYLKLLNLNSNNSTDYLNVLTSKIIDLGIEIYNFRKKYIDLINEKIGEYYEKICHIKDLKIVYDSDYNNLNKNEIISLYKKNINRDIMFGKTNIGIHHDDLKIMINNQNIKDFGSEGQQKNAVIAYNLAIIDIFKEYKGNYPILILDDLFSELDSEKINNILNLINDEIQVFITTTDIDKVNKDILDKSKLFNIVNGEIREV